jgi:trimeric autotransporter adhesin
VNSQTRNRLAACDAATGTLLSWNPNANGVVRALKVSPAGTRVYVGGDFSTVGGAVRSRVAALSPTSGAAFGWSPYVNDQVKSITTSNSGSTVYVGGDFDSAEGAGRRHLAAFNATSGNLTSLKPTISNGTGNFATVLSMDVSADGNTLYFGGDFALVNGTSRRNAAAVSTGVATLRAWRPTATADVVGDLDVSASGRTVFVGGRGAGGYAQAYGPNVGGSPVWNVATNGDVEAIVVSSSILYIGGHFTTVAGASRNHLAALRASGGGLESWNPGANGVFGAYDAAITSSRVAFGGEFTQVAGEAHQGVAQFSGTPVARNALRIRPGLTEPRSRVR